MSTNAMEQCIADVNQLEEWREMERNEKALDAYMTRLEKKYADLKQDAMTLAISLYCHPDSSFAPETLEVMTRWRPLVDEKLRGDA